MKRFAVVTISGLLVAYFVSWALDLPLAAQAILGAVVAIVAMVDTLLRIRG